MEIIKDLEDLKRFAHEAKEELCNESAFEKLLKILVEFDVKESEAEKLISDAINEQYAFDKIVEKFSNVYQDNIEMVINQGNNYQA